MKLLNRGILFVVSSPSGGGKTTVTNCLVQNDKNLVRSVSITTRLPRSQEVDGIDYIFRDEGEFFILHEKRELLEHAKVFNNYYGTIKASVEDSLAQGKDVICCIDWQGAMQIQEKMQSVSVFLLPPSMQILRKRLIERGKDSVPVISNRLEKAKTEIVNYKKYDYLLVNNNFDETLDIMHSIIKAERNKTLFQDKAENFIDILVNEEIESFDK